MRVLQLIDRLRTVGGAERLQLSFARGVAARPARDLDLLVATLGPSDPAMCRAIEATGARVLRFPAPFAADPRRVFRLAALMRSERIDVVHAHLVRSTVLATLAGRLARRPVVATLHNTRRSDRLPGWLVRGEAWALRGPLSAVIACGWETAEAHRARAGARAIEVVPNAVAPGPTVEPVRRAELRAALGVPGHAALLIAVGRLHEQKGFVDLLDAHAQLLAHWPDAHLVIAGEGELRSALERAIAERGSGARVHLTGVRDDVPELLAASDVFVSSSHWEGLPVAILEAMAAGLPIVATAVGDVPRIVDRESAQLVESRNPEGLAEALAALLAQPERMRAMGKAARARAEREFGVETWIERQLAIYARVCAR